MHNFLLLTMLRGECRFPFALLRARGRVGRPLTVLTLSRRPPFATRGTKVPIHHAKYSENKKNVASPTLYYYRFRTTVATWWTRQESATRPCLWYKKIRTSTPTYVKLCDFREADLYICIYIYISVLRILWTRTALIPRWLSARGNNNARSNYLQNQIKICRNYRLARITCNLKL